ncbi:MAG: aldehyde ferredoxin oxidoreductase family protein [Candidatus Korarchaeota archaeon]|nr:aldehyde ferredoxin oxidoreductase family protein [Candidatus Korarchaeota archaeon]NIU84994.1 aldehyde:ferredoxin oxidoreductase [Candidatus Thorarchaeota archaeon]NIW15016.1 aldehyde:ferredoxin oxidoreductase [Candidatus Thorarchaeota archaeon]NIW53026.1 aldehyde:ferredoxin oxidoreductase [Candidatus Korarchaeota archaeon]
MSGYWKTYLEVDLSEGTARKKGLSHKFLTNYIGGAGFTTKILYEEVEQGVDPLGPENILAVAPGLLLGPAVPTASKTVFGFKSPLTEGYGKSVAGAKMGDQIKRAGYDLLVVKGEADTPSLLVIEDDRVSIESAESLWGLDTYQAGDRIKEQYEGFSTALIGLAGEKLSKISMIECEDRQAGRGGAGAVMGSKNLKGIVVKGTKELPIHDEAKLKELNTKWRKITTGKGQFKDLSFSPEDSMEYGTGEALHVKNVELGIFPTRNWQSSYFKKAYDKLETPVKGRIDIDPRRWTKIYRKGRRPCLYCTKPCSQYFVAENTPYGDIAVDGPEYEAQYSLGGATEVDDIEAVAKANEMCDKLGLDVISTGIAISWAMEANERGLLDTDLDLQFGNAQAMLEAIRMIGNKEGKLGKLLFNGVKDAAAKLGKGSEDFAVHVKGMPPAGFEVRGIKGMALAFAVAPRGADHLTSCLYALEMGGSFWEFKGYDRTKMKGKAVALKNMEDLMMVYDMTGMCKFSRGIMYAEGILELVNALTGFDMTISELLTAGARAYNLSKAFNIREGFRRKDDLPPKRVMDEEIPNGPREGAKISREKFQNELDRYYDVRGWNREGIPLKLTLKRLDMPKVAQEIGAEKEY